MFVGHDGISFAAPRSGVRLPLWAFFVAVRWLDVVWWLLVLMGIEKLRITPGFTQANALDLYYMPFTHSLPGALALSAIFAGAVAMFATTGLRDCFCWSQPLVFRIGCSTASCTRPIWRSMMMRQLAARGRQLPDGACVAWDRRLALRARNTFHSSWPIQPVGICDCPKVDVPAEVAGRHAC